MFSKEKGIMFVYLYKQATEYTTFSLLLAGGDLNQVCPFPSSIHNLHFFSKCNSIQRKGRVHCFSMQVVINKCFLLNPEKRHWRKSIMSFSRKTQNGTLYSKNGVTEPKARLL